MEKTVTTIALKVAYKVTVKRQMASVHAQRDLQDLAVIPAKVAFLERFVIKCAQLDVCIIRVMLLMVVVTVKKTLLVIDVILA